MIQVLVPRVLLPADRDDCDKEVILSTRGEYGRAPYGDVPGLVSLDCSVWRSRPGSRRRIVTTEHLSIGVRERQILMALPCVGAERCAAARFKSVCTLQSIRSQVAQRRIQQKIGAREAVREDESGGDDKDQALR